MNITYRVNGKQSTFNSTMTFLPVLFERSTSHAWSNDMLDILLKYSFLAFGCYSIQYSTCCKKKLFSLASTQASTRSRFYAQMNRLTSLKPVYHVPTFKNFEVHVQQEKGSYHGRGFSHWERTVAIKTAMERLGNRSDKIKKPLLAG